MSGNSLRGLGLALALWLAAAAASAQTVLRWLHIETDPVIGAAYEEVARDFEASHPGVKVVVQLLENEAYKAKLPTLLQSPERPHIIHSWGGGVLHAQVQAGVVQDLDAPLRGAWGDSFVPSALGAFRYQGKVWGVPSQMSQVGFYYNRALFAKAGIAAESLKTWPQFLDAVKKLKAAGITPIIAGGGDKWPLHFYWTHLALRIGGRPAFEAALRGEAGGFGGDAFVQAGERMKELVDLKPFQAGWQAVAGPASYGQFGDGRGAMTLMGNWVVPQQRTYAANRKGLAEAELGWLAFPAVPGGRGDPRDTLGGTNGWLLTAGAPPLAVELLKQASGVAVQSALGARGVIVPAVKGAEAGMADVFQKLAAQQIAASPYHQLYYDQLLGPDVGRVVNDVSVELAAGRMAPKAAAEAIEKARRR
jgi:raffinose/stachyose/melibiose transport system substrate-binding protein